MTDCDSGKSCQSSCGHPELREVKLVNVCPGKKVEITFDVKHIEPPPPPPPPSEKDPPPPPDKPGWNQVGTAIVVLVFLTVVVNYYLDIWAKIKVNVTPKPRLHKPYCPKPDPCPHQPYCPKPDPDPCDRFR